MTDHLRILVTGSRFWTDWATVRDALVEAARPWIKGNDTNNGKHVTVVHGGARGADTIAGELAKVMGLNVEVHPADWDRYGKAAGHIRNTEMVNAGADVCLAFPLGESRGTRHCMRTAEKAGIPVVVHEGVLA